MLPVIDEMRRFGAGAITALVCATTLINAQAVADAPAGASKMRLTKRVDAISTGNYGGHLPGAVTLLSPVLSPEVEVAARTPFNPGPLAPIGMTAGIASAFDPAIVLQRGTADDSCRVIYRSDFDSPFQQSLRDEWSYGDIRATPEGRRFLGTIGNGATTLTVSQAPQNGDYVIQFDLLAIGGWKGNATKNGMPAVWGLRVVDGPTLTETTFATDPGYSQSYPDQVGRANFEAGYQAIETFETADGKTATVYRLTYRFNRANAAAETGSDNVRIEFFARGLSSEGKGTPAWGLTNVVLALVPDSGAKGGGGGGSNVREYTVQNVNPIVMAYDPVGFGLMPATGSSPKPASDTQIPAPGLVSFAAVAGLFSLRRKR
ncbi:MAG: hypothetical protein U0570_14980 [Phycisphaerales bacterium]